MEGSKMSDETWPEQVSRLEMMASGEGDWDLSPNDQKAIKAALDLIGDAFDVTAKAERYVSAQPDLEAELRQSLEQTAAVERERDGIEEKLTQRSRDLDDANARLRAAKARAESAECERDEVRGELRTRESLRAEYLARAESAERERDELGRALMAKGADTTQEREVSKLREALLALAEDRALLPDSNGLKWGIQVSADVRRYARAYVAARTPEAEIPDCTCAEREGEPCPRAEYFRTPSPAATTGEAIEQLSDLLKDAGAEAYFVPPPGTPDVACRCTWPDGYPGQPRLSADCPVAQHARLASPIEAPGKGDESEAHAYLVGLKSGEAMGVETAAKLCESMVVGGRAWTHDQSVAADALLTAAQRIRTVIQTAAPSRVIGVDKFTGEPVHSPAPTLPTEKP
jgi:hypothetical protein